MAQWNQTASIRVLIADDHYVFRQGLRLIISKKLFDDIQVVGEAADGAAVLQMASEQPVDVILMDIQMPVMDGIEATARLALQNPGVHVIGLSMFNDPASVQEMLNAGARGFLLKNTDENELHCAIERVYRGDTYLSPALQQRGEMIMPRWKSARELHTLSKREREIVALMRAGASNKEIADRLHISRRTVEGHRLKIVQKLKLRSSSDVIAYAIRHGIN